MFYLPSAIELDGLAGLVLARRLQANKFSIFVSFLFHSKIIKSVTKCFQCKSFAIFLLTFVENLETLRKIKRENLGMIFSVVNQVHWKPWPIVSKFYCFEKFVPTNPL